MKKFIVTNDKNVAKQLQTAGFRLMVQSNGKWVFQNMPPKNFSYESVDKLKMAYTDILPL